MAGLIAKWKSTSREILSTLRDSIGAIIIPHQSATQGWDAITESADYTVPECRTLSLKEVCASFRFDISALGDYDEAMDTFVD